MSNESSPNTHTYNNEAHGKPHCSSSTKPVANKEIDNATRESTKIVYRYNQSDQCIARVVHEVEELRIADDTREHTLIIPEQDKRKLTCKGDGLILLVSRILTVLMSLLTHLVGLPGL